jgi:hypothetical protein
MSTWTAWFGFRASTAEPPAVVVVGPQKIAPRKSYKDALLTPPTLVERPSIDDGYVLVSHIVENAGSK